MNKMTKEQSRDTGMAMVLLLLVLYLRFGQRALVLTAVLLHLVTMTAPTIFRPVAFVWLGLSHLLGEVMSRVVLTVVFFLVVTPVGLIRRLLGRDPLQLRSFKVGSGSVMVRRNHRFSATDLEKPY